MSFAELVKGNETAIISGSFALLGAFLTLVGTSIQKYIDNLQLIRVKRLELAIAIETKHLLEPVINYLENDLTAMQEVYNLIFVKKEDCSKVNINNAHLFQLSGIESRLKALGDEELNINFNKFSQKRINIGNAVESRENDPYKELKDAIDLAGKIMNSLFIYIDIGVIMFNKKKRAIHDFIAGSYVITKASFLLHNAK